MDRLTRPIRSHLQRAKDVERFVQLIVLGGVALVVGLWIGSLTSVGSTPWVLGSLLAIIGLGALGGGIWTEVEY